MLAPIKTYLNQVEQEFDQIAPSRRTLLEGIAEFYRAQEAPAAFNFICTHNSRRSHLGQIWASAAAGYYGLAPIASYSGGTEATAMNERIVAALERVGFMVSGNGSENPRYEVMWSATHPAEVCFSKVYYDTHNPQSGFCAVMTCSDADEGCPVVLGAEKRISLPFVDPKISDGTTAETLTYDARCRQVAREMMYAFSRV